MAGDWRAPVPAGRVVSAGLAPSPGAGRYPATAAPSVVSAVPSAVAAAPSSAGLSVSVVQSVSVDLIASVVRVVFVDHVASVVPCVVAGVVINGFSGRSLYYMWDIHAFVLYSFHWDVFCCVVISRGGLRMLYRSRDICVVSLLLDS